jgi:hypothetical protein
MKSCSRLFLLLIFLTRCFGQEFHGFTIDGPAFPTTSNPAVQEITIASAAPPIAAIPYSYPVPRAARPAIATETRHPTILEFKNHTVDSALTYWVDGPTLHYIDLLNAKRAVPANRIDWTRTAKLNHLVPATRSSDVKIRAIQPVAK